MKSMIVTANPEGGWSTVLLHPEAVVEQHQQGKSRLKRMFITRYHVYMDPIASL